MAINLNVTRANQTEYDAQLLLGIKGDTGKSAYQYAVDGGYEGSETDFLNEMARLTTSADEAAASAEAAQDALDEFVSVTATAETLPAGSDATASYSEGELTLGIPKGDKGDKGDTDGLKKMWSIQTNSNSSGAFYQMGISLDGISSVLVEGTESFLDDAPTNLGSDWLHFQHNDYHVFTITYYGATADFYIAITKDFKTWVHKAGQLGFRSEGGYTDPYVWTPQIFEFNNKLYMSATVQEGAPVNHGSRYQSICRYSGIYVAEISLDYETADVTKLSSFTRISFEEVTDKKGNTYDISGNAMDAWFVPFGDKLVCVFNDRYLLEIHTAIADSIGDTFEILAQNIFKMPCTEAPTVLQINEKLWQVCGCYYGYATIAKECNIRCVTSDFEHFYEYAFIKRIDVETGSTTYTGRMRNPSFFYMTDEQEHEFCNEHPIKVCGYQHIFEPQVIRMDYVINDMFNYTDVAIPMNTEFDMTTAAIDLPKFDVPKVYGCNNYIRIVNSHTAKKSIKYAGTTYYLLPNQYIEIDIETDSIAICGATPGEKGTNAITPNSDSYDVASFFAQKDGNITSINATIGNVALSSGANTIGVLATNYRPYYSVFANGFVGAGSAYGNHVRLQIASNGTITAYASSAISSSTLRFSVTYQNEAT